MTLTVQDITRMLKQSAGMRRGAAMNRLSRDRQKPELTRNQRAFLEDLRNTPHRQTVTVPQHPEEIARQQRRDRGGGDELTAVELAWLQRLPLDPKQITFDTAVDLASLARSISEMKSPASARLIESIWAPVKALHDERVAAAKAELAREPAPTAPASAEAAVSDALAQQFPDEHPVGVAERAREVLASVDAEHQRKHDDALSSAQAQLETARRVVAAQQEMARETMVSP